MTTAQQLERWDGNNGYGYGYDDDGYNYSSYGNDDGYDGAAA
jgi:hypothetical protein